jgi:hypothetical protein
MTTGSLGDMDAKAPMLRYTQSKHHVPSPRDATSVAIRIGDRPALNSPSTQSRSRLVSDQLN